MQAEFLSSLLECPATDWDALWPGDYPFTRHAFLSALEVSGCTDEGSGWQPAHLLLRDEQRLLAAMPLYEKTHSYGEYVFDWGWADAYHRAGLDYYPKLLNAIPFTPATGPRIGFNPNLDDAEKKVCMQVIFDNLEERIRQSGGSGFHCLFPSADNRQLLSLPKLAERRGCQFHWFNRDYQSFDDFLAQFSSRKRKNLKRERQKVYDQNIQLQFRTPAELSEDDWRLFYLLYQRTYFKRSGHQGYLTQAFFKRIANTLPQHILLCSAHQGDLSSEMLAAALYFYDSDTLYGRYWGTKLDVDGLHFETCYYQGIEYAISHGLKRFDPGAQGEHKIQRGFTPVLTCSYHYLAQPQFHQAICQFVQEEQAHNRAYCDDGRNYLPFKEGVEIVPANLLLDHAE